MNWSQKQYDDFYKTQSPNFCDEPERHAKTASLCRGKTFDIGCCFGILSDYYFGDYRGYDFSEYCVNKAKEIRRKDADFVLHDCSNLQPLPIEACDTFVFANFLEHFENDDKIFAPIFSRHKKDARIVIVVPNSDRVPDPSHVRIFTVSSLRKKFEPHGRVKFYNWPGAKNHIICTVDLDKRAANLLSLVMIVKNEAKGIENAILSCIEYVDNIVIACDDASTDKTKDIAQIYADTLKLFTWRDDFSWARNFAHEGVKTSWILSLDGHEYVAKWPEIVYPAHPDIDGILVSVELETGTIFRYPRIYRSDCHFENRVHNKISCKHAHFEPGVLIKHDRLHSQSAAAIAERRAQQNDMIPRIMGEELRKNPKNTRASFHLALHFHARHDWKKALKYQKAYLRFSKNRGERWLVYFNRALCNFAIGRHFFALWNADRANEEISGRWEIAKLKGQIFAASKNYKKALEFLVHSFNLNEFEFSYKPWPRDDANTWNLIGECFFNLGNYQKAYTAFDRAASVCENKDGKQFLAARAELMSKMAAAQVR